jgi:hypothetical protein
MSAIRQGCLGYHPSAPKLSASLRWARLHARRSTPRSAVICRFLNNRIRLGNVLILLLTFSAFIDGAGRRPHPAAMSAPASHNQMDGRDLPMVPR